MKSLAAHFSLSDFDSRPVLRILHGDNGAGLGASHQTGWTGVVARMMHLFAATT
jgi:hypothetical protein